MPEIFLLFIGFPMLGFGGMFLSIGYRRAVSGYMASQTAPVASKYANYIIDETSDSI